MKLLTSILFLFFCVSISAQLTEECKLKFGTNLSGVVDYGTELPFVDLMHNARVWYTKDIGNPQDPFDSGHASELNYRSDGYPTHVPQQINSSNYDQRVVTIWAITDGWPAGEYTVLWEGTGTLSFWGGHSDLQQTDSNRITFDFLNPIDNALEMTIVSSDIDDPIHNIRVLMPGTEMTYDTDPFYSLWIEKLSIFPSVRFMDWGTTNSWGQPDNWTWDDPSFFTWNDRAQMNHYTWATNKGIPYEMMIKLLNDYDLDGWVCVPHRADDNYIENMAILFRDNLNVDRHLTVEYSNEIWNWIFGQTQWLNKYGCELQNTSWPEGLVPYIQNCLDIWSTTFQDQMNRITRVAGVQLGWQDVSNRMVNNLEVGSFDAIKPTFYFGLTEEGDTNLDVLGSDATVEDVAYYARLGMQESMSGLESQKNQLADPLGVGMVFYEGGQHITPDPFGVEPTYSQALLDIQRDSSMFNMYNEWFDFLRTLQEGDTPLSLMNFSFVAERSARFGSWGILETMAQDTSLIPAPKYAAILKAIQECDLSVSTIDPLEASEVYTVFPNPTSDFITISGDLKNTIISLCNSKGQIILSKQVHASSAILNVQHLTQGTYYLQINNENKIESKKVIVLDL